MELPGWDTADYKPSTPWKPLAPLADAPRGALRPWSSPPVALDRIIKPVGIAKTANGKAFVVDFGVNVAGVVKLSNIKLKKGQNVTLAHGEIMQVQCNVCHPCLCSFLCSVLHSASASFKGDCRKQTLWGAVCGRRWRWYVWPMPPLDLPACRELTST